MQEEEIQYEIVRSLNEPKAGRKVSEEDRKRKEKELRKKHVYEIEEAKNQNDLKINEEHIVIGGKREAVPRSVTNLKAYVRFRELQESYKSKEWRTVKLSDGSELTLPAPQYKAYLKSRGFGSEEIKRVHDFIVNVVTPVSLQLSYAKRAAFATKGFTLGTKFYRDAKKEKDATLGLEWIEENETTLLEWFGRFVSPKEAHERALVQAGLSSREFPYESIYRFFLKNRDKIRDLRSDLKENYDDLDVGIKRSRLEKLNHLLITLLPLYNSALGSAKLNFSKEIRAILEDAKKECDGDLKISVNGTIDVTATIETSMKSVNLISDLTIMQMVMSRVAARLGVPYARIVDKLANSYYSKFNGFRRNNDLTEKPIYPTSISYDILDMKDVIERKAQKNKEIEEALFEEIPIDKAVGEGVIVGLREKLREKINKNKESRVSL